MSRPSTVTVIMPVSNGERFVAAALDSLFAQTLSEFVVIAVDDGSTDRTRDILAGCRDERLRIIRVPERAGVAAARNRALDLADSPYIAFLDSDDIAEPQRLEIQVGLLRRRPEVGMVSACVRLADEDGASTGEVWGTQAHPAAIVPSLLFRNSLMTSTVVVTREALGAERFDSTLAVASDYDMWLRITNRATLAWLPDVIVQYRVHSQGLTQRSAAASEACLDRIALRQLARLGIAPSPAELALHGALGRRHVPVSRPVVERAALWLDRLEAANRVSAAYPSDVFARVIEAEWLSLCDAAARGGCWETWRSVFGASLTRRLVADPLARPQAARLPWRMARGYVRRRWPRLGATVRTAFKDTAQGA